jgi:hypothetical protein
MRFLLVLLLSLMSWSVLSQNTRLGRIRKVVDSTGKYTPIKYLAIEYAKGYARKLRFFEESDISFQLNGKKPALLDVLNRLLIVLFLYR